MPEKQPDQSSGVQALYNSIAPIIESSTGAEAQTAVRELNLQLFLDMRSEAEVLLLMYGQGVSDRYLYGLCSAIVAMTEENGGSLPRLSTEQYELDHETQDSHYASQDESAMAYFYNLDCVFEAKFPLTHVLLSAMENDLRTRLQASPIDVEEGFIPGWYKAVKSVVPLFIEE